MQLVIHLYFLKFLNLGIITCQCLFKMFLTFAEFIWSQEEHRNSGAWSFVCPRFENVVGIKV